jgi:hypothetical protein
MNKQGNAAAPPQLAPNVKGSSLEPMFVQTTLQHALQSNSKPNSHQLLDYKRQVDNLRQASAVVAQVVNNHAQSATWMQDTELLRRYEWQMEQLRNASAVAAAASAANDARSDMPQSVDLQADLEKLTQNIGTLSLQLSRFEMQIQDRMNPMSADLMASAALAQVMGQLPEPPATPGVGMHTGFSAASPLPYSAMFGLAANGNPGDGNPKKI